MSDEDALPAGDEETAAIDLKSSAATAQQPIRMPQSFEFASAVLGRRDLPGFMMPLSAFVNRRYLYVIGALWAVLVVSVVFGWLWPGVIAYGLTALADYLANRSQQRESLLLRRLGMQSHVRHFVRGVLLVALLGRLGLVVPTIVFTALLLVMILIQVLDLSTTAWLSSRQPPLVYRPDGNQTDSARAYARVYRRSSWTPRWLTITDIVAVLVIGLGIELDATPLLLIGAAAAAITWMAAVETRALLRAVKLGSDETVARVQAEVTGELDELAPEVLVYMAGGALAEYILNQWIPTMERLHQRSFVIIREAMHLRTVMVTPIPLVYAPSTRHVEELTRASVRVAFYPANAGKNVHLLREARLKHVFLNHGDSDKSTSANPFVRVYDEVWVAGEAAVERYEAAGIHMPRKQYAIVGRPQVEPLKVGPLAAPHQQTVLYAPTFEGYYEESNYSSLEFMGPEMIRRLLETRPDVRIIFKPHPATGVARPGMARARLEIVRMLGEHAGAHLYVPPGAELSLMQCFDLADLLLSDISSVVTDFLYTQRPLVTTNPRGLARELFDHTFPTQRASYILDVTLDNFDALVADALGPDSLRQQRLAMSHYVLGDHPKGPTATFVQQTDRLVVEAAAHAASIRNEFRIKTDP